MVQFLIKGMQINANNLWYHYNEHPVNGTSYELSITIEEKGLFHTIEKYCNCSLDDINIQDIVLQKDKSHRSIGLMWHILQHIQNSSKNNDFEWDWVINNITKIYKEQDVLKIAGEVSDFIDNF